MSNINTTCLTGTLFVLAFTGLFGGPDEPRTEPYTEEELRELCINMRDNLRMPELDCETWPNGRTVRGER